MELFKVDYSRFQLKVSACSPSYGWQLTRQNTESLWIDFA